MDKISEQVRGKIQALIAHLEKASRVCLYPHENMDGDALGSCVALCKRLRQEGKTAWVVIDEPVPDNLLFLDQGYCTDDRNLALTADTAMLIDCGEPSRIGSRAELFLATPGKLCIDHHSTSRECCDINWIDPVAAATGQMIYLLLTEMGTKPDPEIGNALFAAITTDTGNFQYSNTQKISHEIVADLYDWGILPNQVSMEIYESNRPERILIESRALSTLKLLFDGRVAMAYVSQRMFQETGAAESETERVIVKMRSLKGIDIAVFLKEKKKGSISISFRSKSDRVNVARIASAVGGGGHTKAAGATLKDMDLSEAWQRVQEAIADELGRAD